MCSSSNALGDMARAVDFVTAEATPLIRNIWLSLQVWCGFIEGVVARKHSLSSLPSPSSGCSGISGLLNASCPDGRHACTCMELQMVDS